MADLCYDFPQKKDSKRCIFMRGFTKFGIKGIVKATVSGVFQDLTFEISEGSDQNWSCPESAQLAVSV